MKNPTCASIRAKSKVTSHTQYPPDPVNCKVFPSLPNINVFGKEFMESLLSFMQHSHNFLMNWKQVTGKQLYTMNNEERQYKIKQIMNLIAQKEKELTELEAIKAQLAGEDTFSTFSSMTEDQSLRSTSPQQPYEYPSLAFPAQGYDESTLADVEYSTAPDYTEYDTQNESLIASPVVNPLQYPAAGYSETNSEYTAKDVPMKYYRTQ